MNLTSLSYFFVPFNWIPSLAMLMTPMAIAGMDKMAIMAIMVTSVMDNGNFSMAVRGIQLMGTK